MKRTCIVVAFLLSVTTGFAQKGADIHRPKLVVGIVVDQMRWDYLYRFYDHFTAGGFKRLMNEGFNCQNTMINYLPSFTAPGHSCIYTGSVPAIHGIVGNEWVDNVTGKFTYCVEDANVQAIAGSAVSGKMSPQNLLTTTITDELRLATNMRSKVYSLSLKDRGAILPGGHLANGSFWFDDTTGNFMTSTYHNSALPGWLVNFNSKRWADTLIREKWDLMYHDIYGWETETETDINYEGMIPGENKTWFNHNAEPYTARGYYKLRFLPGGNSIVFKAAKACIKGASLGQGDNTDFLCLSFSTTDYIGHTFGPNSIEVQDLYYGFDAELASFCDYLDRYMGRGNYTLFLTADHGAAHNSAFLKDMDIPAGNALESTVSAELKAYVKTKTGHDSLVKAMMNYQVYLNENIIEQKKLKREDVKKLVMEWLEQQEGVAYVMDLENLNNTTVPEEIKSMIVNGYNRLRSGCIQIVLQPGWYSGYMKTGTTHGTWNPYDTHIPLLWCGWGIPHGETHREVHMTDIAATLAALLHIQMPNGCVGKVITEIVE